jgi:hypothetical protein
VTLSTRVPLPLREALTIELASAMAARPLSVPVPIQGSDPNCLMAIILGRAFVGPFEPKAFPAWLLIQRSGSIGQLGRLKSFRLPGQFYLLRPSS